MEFFKPGLYMDVMKWRNLCVGASIIAILASIAGFFYPGPNYGIDFRGGTELQVQFNGRVTSAELRRTLAQLGHAEPEVISVEGHANQYMIRVAEVSSVSAAQQTR